MASAMVPFAPLYPFDLAVGRGHCDGAAHTRPLLLRLGRPARQGLDAFYSAFKPILRATVSACPLLG